MISKTKIKERKKKKTKAEVVETLEMAIKNPAWKQVAEILSGSTQKYSSKNLKEIENETSAGDTVIIPGKVLGTGSLTKKVRICALGFSKEALEKIKKVKGEAVMIAEEIKKNPKGEGVKVLR